VYEQGSYVADTSMTQVSVGLQAGGQAFGQIIFFENKTSFDEFASGKL
jgi:lipid-binding SYLF domain-containing protein